MWQPSSNWVATAPHKEARQPPQEWTWYPPPGWWKHQVVNLEPGNFRHDNPHGHAGSEVQHCNVQVCVKKLVEGSTGARVCSHARHCTMCGLHRFRHIDSYGELQNVNCIAGAFFVGLFLLLSLRRVCTWLKMAGHSWRICRWALPVASSCSP